jgi:outer membrane protein TolC
LNVEIPINRNVGPIAQAEARRKTSEARFLAQQSAIQGEVDTALAAYRASRAKASIAAAIARETKAATDTTKRLLDAGQVSALELTRHQVEASAANVALMTATIEAQTAAGALEDAMQATLK